MEKTQKSELAYWLAVYRFAGIGPKRFSAILSTFKRISACFDGERPTTEFLSWCEANGIHGFSPDWKNVEADLRWATAGDNHIVHWESPAYPAQLKHIPDPPPILYIQGQLSALSLPQIAMVGSRHPSVQGKENAYRFAYALSEQGFAITSGLALGVDGASHKGALGADGITLAVLGSGLDKLYPIKHRDLACAISQQGAMISEFPLGVAPKSENFPRRNRVISGLSVGVVVVEAALKSGSLITARYALEQGREVFALPGSIMNPMAKGCHHLIRQGAKCVESVEHIMEELPSLTQFTEVAVPQSKVKNSTNSDLSPEQQQFLCYIGEECTPVDQLVERSGLTAEQVSSMLLPLELQGEIVSVPGGYVLAACESS